MIRRKVFMIWVITLSAIAITQAFVIIKPFNRHKVTTAESALLVAKAELIRRYGEDEILSTVLFASEDCKYWWLVTEGTVVIQGETQTILPDGLDNTPRVYIRKSDGKAVVIWRDGVRKSLFTIFRS